MAGITVFDPAGYSHVGDPEFIPTYTLTQELQISDTLSLVRGRHSMKTGFQLRKSYFDLFQIPQPRGKFSFSGEFTQDPDHNDGTGDPLADALLGYSSQIDISNITQTRNRTPVFGAFFQDDFKVKSSLTLNLGSALGLHGSHRGGRRPPEQLRLRDRPGPGRQPERQLAGPDRRGQVRLRAPPRLRLDAVQGRQDRVPRRLRDLLRGAGGAHRLPARLQHALLLRAVEVERVRRHARGLRGTRASRRWTRPRPPSRTLFPPIGASRAPYYQQWNFSVQRDLGWNTLLEVAYVGSKGTHLQVLRDYNQPQPGPGDPQERRPYPQYGNFGSITNAGSSTYNSIQLKLNKRWSNGLWLLSAFTYGKAYNDQPEICCASPWPPDSYNIARASTAPPTTTSAIARSRASRGTCPSGRAVTSSTRRACSTASSAAGSSAGS